jgi:signal transduction histidine kinase
MWRLRYVALLLSALLPPAAGAAEPQRVLLLHSFGPHYPPWNAITPLLREELQTRASRPIDLYEASLQADRFALPEETPFLGYLQSLLTGRRLDLLITIGAPATRFAMRHRAQLFTSTPLLIAATDARAFGESALTSQDAVAPVAIDSARHIEHILQVLPDTTDIVVALGDSPLERFWTGELRRTFERFAGRVTIHWLNELSAGEMVQRVANLPPRHAIYYATVRVDAHGAPQEGDQVLQQFFKVAKAPIFTYIDSQFGQGILGGPLLSTGEIAAASANAAVRILDGEAPDSVRLPAVSEAAPKYDWRQLRRWGIGEARLPPGSSVHFRVPSLWEQYRLQIVTLGTVLVFQTLLIVWLIHEHRQRNRAELRSRKAMSELANMNRLAAAGQLSASIAHEVSQPIAGIVMLASAALRWLKTERPDVERASGALTDIVGAGHQAADIVTGIRAMFKKDSSTKVPVNINNLINTVLALMRTDLNSRGVRVETKLSESLPAAYGDPVQLQQVILNLIANAADAMQAVQPRLLTIQSDTTRSGAVHVSFEDSGTGIAKAAEARIFDPLFTTKASGMGMGLSICRSIIEGHGGRIWASAAPDRGAVFQFDLPAATGASSEQAAAA